MRFRRFALWAPFALFVVAWRPLAAQGTRDQSRLVFNISTGFAFGGSLWRVSGQPLFDQVGSTVEIDTLTLTRRVRPGFMAGVKAIYFRSANLGFMAEANLLGIGFRDDCVQTYASGSDHNTQVCNFLRRSEKSGNAVQFQAGLVYRVNSRRTISPYVLAAAGAVIENSSSVRMTGSFTDVTQPGDSAEPVDVEIYRDDAQTRVTPGAVLGAGFTAVLGPGYQLRWEVRDNIAGLRKVTGATAVQGRIPPSSLAFRHLISLSVGVDIVLERKRGRRY